MATTITALPYKLQLEEGESVAIADEPGPLPDGMLQNQIILYAFRCNLEVLSRTR